MMGHEISWIQRMMDDHPHGTPVESSLNMPEGKRRFREQMETAMEPHWKHFDEARTGSLVRARQTMLRGGEDQ